MSRNTAGNRNRGRGGGRHDDQRPSPSIAHHGGSSRGRGRGRGDIVAGAESSVTPLTSPAPAPVPDTITSLESRNVLSEEMKKKLHVRVPMMPESSESKSEPPVPAAPPASSKSIRHPARPGYGKLGRPCVVKANHFLVQVEKNDIYHYDVAIAPESRKNTNRKIVSQLVLNYGEQFLGGRMPAYDGMKSLYTAGALPFESKEFMVKLTPTVGQGKARLDEFKVTIRLAGRADLYHLMEFLVGRQMDAPQETIQALDVVLRQFPCNNYITVGRSFFSTQFGHTCDIGNGLECWRGYYQSLRPTQMGLSLNIDICATSFYKPVGIVEFVSEFLGINDSNRPLAEMQRIKLKKTLRGVRVEVTHSGDLRRTYRISGVTNLPTSQLTFPCDEQGTIVTMAEYFRKQYNVSLKYLKWPCLEVGSSSKATYLPMEVCKIVEGQRHSKRLNERQVTEILKATCQRPLDREKSIVDTVNYNNYNSDKYAKEFGITVGGLLAKVDARVLPPPNLKYHDSGKEKSCRPSVGQWNMINKRMYTGGFVQNWACLNLSSRVRNEEVTCFCDELVKMCNNIGMKFNTKPFTNFVSARPDKLESSLRQIFGQCSTVLKPNGEWIQLLIIILPEMSGFYGRIKRVCETELGIISQCCQPRHVFKCNKQYLENVALKINVKTGGRNTVLEDALNKRIPLVTDAPTIIFGADVTHPPPGEDSAPSIAAVVASMDWPHVTKYMALVSAQSSREEMIQNLFTVHQDPKRGTVAGGLIRELLMGFYKSTKQKPHRIIFYRDGVSEGQFNQVLLHEMDSIRKACASLQADYQPLVTFIVVQKRHHTRIFPNDHKSTDKSGNILPGTVVDRMICHPTENDFFLCSHAGIKGTSRPTHYHVLWDENKFTADDLQSLTYNLCYTYARCTRSVSIVPPAFYAHLAAFRARYYMEDEVSDRESSVGTSGVSQPVRELPAIADNVKQVMFFC